MAGDASIKATLGLDTSDWKAGMEEIDRVARTPAREMFKDHIDNLCENILDGAVAIGEFALILEAADGGTLPQIEKLAKAAGDLSARCHTLINLKKGV